MTSPVTSSTDSTPDLPAFEPGEVPPFAERAIGALIADPRLREAVLGDLAEGFAARCARYGPAQARRWYRGQAARSAPALLAATWWPAPSRRRGRVTALLAAGVGGCVLLQLLYHAAQVLAAVALAAVGQAGDGGPLVACSVIAYSLVAGAACAVLAGAVAARGVREAPLAGALALAAACGALAVTGVLVNGGAGPLWYWGGLQLVVLPAGACAGGLLRTTRAAGDHDRAEGS